MAELPPYLVSFFCHILKHKLFLFMSDLYPAIEVEHRNERGELHPISGEWFRSMEDLPTRLFCFLFKFHHVCTWNLDR